MSTEITIGLATLLLLFVSAVIGGLIVLRRLLAREASGSAPKFTEPSNAHPTAPE